MGSKSSAKKEMELAEGKKQSMFAALQNFMRWIPTSRKDIIASEQRLLTLIKSVTPSPSFPSSCSSSSAYLTTHFFVHCGNVPSIHHLSFSSRLLLHGQSWR
jgi:hypothetical protein